MLKLYGPRNEKGIIKVNKLRSSFVTAALIAVLGLSCFLPLGEVVHAQTTTAITAPVVPDKLKAPSGELPFLKAFAKGAQIYICTANATDATKFEWTLKAPEAELFNEQGVKIGKHYAGPTWEGTDGSKVVGEVKERADAPAAKGIPWLLLKAKENTGTGLLSKVSSVQRVDTVAGFAPRAENCDQTKKDSEARIDYSATYYFYAPESAVKSSPAGVPATGLGGNQSDPGFTEFFPLMVGGLTLISILAGLLLLTTSHQNRRPKV